MQRAKVLRRGSIAALTSLVLLQAAASALAQETQSEPTPDAGSAERVQSIAAAEVAGRAEALSRQLRQARARMAPEPGIEEIEASLVDRSREVEAKRADTLFQLGAQPTLAKLDALERDWSRHESELAIWRQQLTERVSALGADVDELSATQSIWRATLEDATEREAPAELLEAIGRSHSELLEVRDTSSAQRGSVLALQTRVAQQELIVADALEDLKSARNGLRSRLLEPNEPPIWQAWFREDKPAQEQIASAFTASETSVLKFVEARQTRFVPLAAFFLFAWLGALGLKRSIAVRRAAGGEIEHSSRVFERPLALSALLALLSTFWFFPLAPEAFFSIVGLLLLIPLLRLLPTLMHPGFHSILHGVAAFYVVDRLRGVMEGAPLVGRMVFSLECAAAALFCFALLRPSRLTKIPDPQQFPTWPSHVLRLGLAVFAVAFLANWLGYLSLATLLGEGTLASVYTGIGVYAGVQVFGVILNVTTKTAWAHQIHFLRARRSVAVDWIRWAAAAAAGVLWAYWSLGAFAIQDDVFRAVSSILGAALSFGTVAISLGDLLAFAATVGGAILLSRVIRFVLMEDVFSRVRTARGIPHAVSATAHYLILFSGFLLALAAAGIDFSRFALLAGAFGVGIGFGLQNVVNNFVSGIILLFERPISVGDTIDMGDLVGHVRRIGIRSSTVRTLTGAEVIVPNADLISQRVINWTLSDKTRRVSVSIGVAYGTDPEQIMQMLTSLAAANERVLPYPAPLALFRSHGDSSLDFELRVWVGNFDDSLLVESELNVAINMALAEADVEIPFPQRDLHLRSVDPSAGQQLGRNEE